MNKEVSECVERIMDIFPQAFINRLSELIVEPKNNIYFRLEDVETKLDFDCKMLAWLSRPSCKGVSPYWQNIIRNGFNAYFEKQFTEDEMMHIYTYLGNDCNRSLSIKFLESGMDLFILPAE